MNRIPVFYSPQQSLEKVISFSKSPNKPKLLADFWKQQKLPVQFHNVKPIDREIYKLAHSAQYVDGLFSLKIVNGFGTFDKNVLNTLPYLTSSVIAAGELVLQSQTNEIAYSLSSGSHHSCWNSGGGFCSLNHNVTAAIYLKNKFKLKSIGLLDVDAHFSDGDFDIQKRLKLDWLKIYSFGGEGIKAANSNDWLQSFHAKCLEFETCDLVIVNCAVDPHLDDALGGVLTTEQMRRRDAIIFETMKLLNKKTVVTLGGGYQELGGTIQPVLDLHTNTLKEISRIYLKS